MSSVNPVKPTDSARALPSFKAASLFAKFGARITSVTDHGWGTDMHRVDMAIYL